MGTPLSKAITDAKSRGGRHFVLEGVEKDKYAKNTIELEKCLTQISHNLPELVRISVNSCQLLIVPEGIGLFTNIRVLSLEDNGITQMPKSFSNLKNLEELYLSRNGFTSLPPALGSFPKLTILSFNYNLVGIDPASAEKVVQEYLENHKLSQGLLDLSSESSEVTGDKDSSDRSTSKIVLSPRGSEKRKRGKRKMSTFSLSLRKSSPRPSLEALTESIHKPSSPRSTHGHHVQDEKERDIRVKLKQEMRLLEKKEKELERRRKHANKRQLKHKKKKEREAEREKARGWLKDLKRIEDARSNKTQASEQDNGPASARGNTSGSSGKKHRGSIGRRAGRRMGSWRRKPPKHMMTMGDEEAINNGSSGGRTGSGENLVFKSSPNLIQLSKSSTTNVGKPQKVTRRGAMDIFADPHMLGDNKQSNNNNNNNTNKTIDNNKPLDTDKKVNKKKPATSDVSNIIKTTQEEFITSPKTEHKKHKHNKKEPIDSEGVEVRKDERRHVPSSKRHKNRDKMKSKRFDEDSPSSSPKGKSRRPRSRKSNSTKSNHAIKDGGKKRHKSKRGTTGINMHSLTFLNLARNSLREFPEEINMKSLSRMNKLNLEYNNFSRVQASLLRSLPDLQSLSLRANELTSVPEEIKHVPGLFDLVLRSNHIHSLPDAIGFLTSLKLFDASCNQLSALPASLGQLSSLRTLHLENNLLEHLPEELGQLSQLHLLNVADNKLNKLPGTICRGLTSLTELNVSDNCLDSLPREIGLLCSLKKLLAGNNKLTLLPPEFNMLTSVQVVQLEGNNFYMLPPPLLHMRLYRLQLENNPFDSLTNEYIHSHGSLQLLRASQSTLNRIKKQPPGLMNKSKRPPYVEWHVLFEMLMDQMNLPPSRRNDMTYSMSTSNKWTLLVQSKGLGLLETATNNHKNVAADMADVIKGQVVVLKDITTLRVMLASEPTEWTVSFAEAGGILGLNALLKQVAHSSEAIKKNTTTSTSTSKTTSTGKKSRSKRGKSSTKGKEEKKGEKEGDKETTPNIKEEEGGGEFDDQFCEALLNCYKCLKTIRLKTVRNDLLHQDVAESFVHLLGRESLRVRLLLADLLSFILVNRDEDHTVDVLKAFAEGDEDSIGGPECMRRFHILVDTLHSVAKNQKQFGRVIELCTCVLGLINGVLSSMEDGEKRWTLRTQLMAVRIQNAVRKLRDLEGIGMEELEEQVELFMVETGHDNMDAIARLGYKGLLHHVQTIYTTTCSKYVKEDTRFVLVLIEGGRELELVPFDDPNTTSVKSVCTTVLSQWLSSSSASSSNDGDGMDLSEYGLHLPGEGLSRSLCMTDAHHLSHYGITDSCVCEFKPKSWLVEVHCRVNKTEVYASALEFDPSITIDDAITHILNTTGHLKVHKGGKTLATLGATTTGGGGGGSSDGEDNSRWSLFVIEQGWGVNSSTSGIMSPLSSPRSPRPLSSSASPNPSPLTSPRSPRQEESEGVKGEEGEEERRRLQRAEELYKFNERRRYLRAKKKRLVKLKEKAEKHKPPSLSNNNNNNNNKKKKKEEEKKEEEDDDDDKHIVDLFYSPMESEEEIGMGMGMRRGGSSSGVCVVEEASGTATLASFCISKRPAAVIELRLKSFFLKVKLLEHAALQQFSVSPYSQVQDLVQQVTLSIGIKQEDSGLYGLFLSEIGRGMVPGPMGLAGLSLSSASSRLSTDSLSSRLSTSSITSHDTSVPYHSRKSEEKWLPGTASLMECMEAIINPRVVLNYLMKLKTVMVELEKKGSCKRREYVVDPNLRVAAVIRDMCDLFGLKRSEQLHLRPLEYPKDKKKSEEEGEERKEEEKEKGEENHTKEEKEGEGDRGDVWGYSLDRECRFRNSAPSWCTRFSLTRREESDEEGRGRKKALVFGELGTENAGRIVAGTLDGLVAYACSTPVPLEFLRVFFHTYVTFTTSSELLDAFSRHILYLDDTPDPMKALQEKRQLYIVVRCWVNNFIAEEALSEPIHVPTPITSPVRLRGATSSNMVTTRTSSEAVGTLGSGRGGGRRVNSVSTFSSISDKAKKQIFGRLAVEGIAIDPLECNRLLGFHETQTQAAILQTRRGTIVSVMRRGVKPKAVEKAHPSLFTKLTLLDLDEKEVARQLCLRDFAYFSNIKPWEFLNKGWAKSKTRSRSPNLMEMVDRFNAMSYSVAGLIINETKLTNRRKVFQRLIKIADALRKFNNYHTLAAFLGAFSNSAVERLKWTKETLPNRLKSTHKELEALMNITASYKLYREALSNSSAPCIPFMGLALFDLTFIEEGNPDLVDGRINWEKRRMLYDTIKPFQKMRKLNYSFSPDPNIITWIDSLPHVMNDKELWEQSLLIEPRNAERCDIK